jgi:cytochrome P450
MPQWVVHRDPRFWDDPETFRPERWSEPRMKDLPHFAYFPFGGGPRVCVGNNFALLETALILPVIAQRFRFTLVPDHPVEPHPTFTLRPRDGVPAVIESRSSQPNRAERWMQEETPPAPIDGKTPCKHH